MSALRLRFQNPSTLAWSAWTNYTVEIDTSVTNALSYRTTLSNLGTPAQWAGTPNGAQRTFEWNLRLADGTLAYPEVGTVTEKAATKAQQQAWLGLAQQLAQTSGRTLTITNPDGTTTTFNVPAVTDDDVLDLAQETRTCLLYTSPSPRD